MAKDSGPRPGYEAELVAVAGEVDRRRLAEDALERARHLVEATTPQETRRAREGALRYFWAWAAIACGLREHYPVPAWVAVKFLVDHVDGLEAGVDQVLVDLGVKREIGALKLSTVEVRLRHLAKAHSVQDLPSPTATGVFRETLQATKRRFAQRGERPRKMAPVTMSVLEQLVATCDAGELVDLRDRALLMVMWGGGGRRASEAAAARVEDLEEADGDYLWTIRLSKTDQEGAGKVTAVRYRAASALRAWLQAAKIRSGHVFRRILKSGRLGGDPEKAMSRQAILNIVRGRVAAAGLDPAIFGTHSLRHGFVTDGVRAGLAERDLMAATGHKTRATFEGYAAEGRALKNPALGRLK